MIYFISLYYIIFLLSLVDFYYKYRKILSFIIILILSLFVGLRYGNKDYFNYVLFFDQTPDISNFFTVLFSGVPIGIVEPGFYFFNSLVKIFTNNLEIYFFILCFISLYLLLYSFSKLHKNYLIIFLIGVSSIFIGTYFTQVRQGLALGFSAIAIMYLIYHKNKKFWFFSIVAFFIHTSAIAIFILPLFRNIKFKRIYIIFIPIALIVNKLHIDYLLLNFLGSILGDGHIADKINLFFFSGRENRTISMISGINILVSFLIISMVLFKHKIRKEINWIDFLIWTLVIGLFYYNIFSSAGEVAGRLFREMTILMPFAIYFTYTSLNVQKYFSYWLLSVVIGIFFLYYGHAGEGFYDYESRVLF